MEQTTTDKPAGKEKGGKDEMTERLPFCTKAPSAEQARKSDDDEPCDDARAGGTLREKED